VVGGGHMDEQEREERDHYEDLIERRERHMAGRAA
jgi:hypothetical protein